MGVEFRGADRLMSKIRAIPKVMEDAVFEATFDIVDETVARATSHLQSSIDHRKLPLTALCRRHHMMIHTLGLTEFMTRFEIHPVYLNNEELISKLEK